MERRKECSLFRKKRGPDLFFKYFKKSTVLMILRLMKLHYLLMPNTPKYLKLQYFKEPWYFPDTSKK
jgi:hypothetical protein